MSDAVWGLIGVGVGAGVTFLTTWWQLNRARDSEEKAHKRERRRLRREAEATAISQLLATLAEWTQRLTEAGLGVRPLSESDVLPLTLRVSYLAGCLRDDDVREAMNGLLDLGLAYSFLMNSSGPRANTIAAGNELLERYGAVQTKLTRRWRRLT